jgi:hypothetical protein
MRHTIHVERSFRIWGTAVSIKPRGAGHFVKITVSLNSDRKSAAPEVHAEASRPSLEGDRRLRAKKSFKNRIY